VEPAGSLSEMCTGAVVPFPPLTERLIAALAAQFPEQAADLDWNDREVWFKAGQVSVVRWLAAQLEEQEQGGPFLMGDD
jgi:hypothetical protein